MEQAVIQLGALLRDTPGKEKKTIFKRFIDLSHVVEAFISYSEMSDEERTNLNVFDSCHFAQIWRVNVQYKIHVREIETSK